MSISRAKGLISFRTVEGKRSDFELSAISILRISKLFILLLALAALFQVNDSVSYGMLIP